MESSTRRKRKKNVRRKNAKLYPIYKMFSWDLLCYYSIEYLFLTITKGVSISDVLLLSAFYLISKMLVQIPSVTICDFLGRKRSIVLGNAMLVGYMFTLIVAPNMPLMLFAMFLCAFGYAIKNLSETNLLYDSVATRGGDGLYSRIDSKGGSLYYVFDGIASLVAGYLFVVNNYLPVIICLLCLIIATILSCGFSDVYDLRQKKSKDKSLLSTFKEYGNDLKDTCKFIFNSSRMKALILFRVVFYSLIKIIDIYRSDLLVDIGIPEEQFSMIFAVLTFIAAIAVSAREALERRYKNRILTVISLAYIFAVISVGVISCISASQTILPIILIMYVIAKVCSAIWFVLEGKYVKNFTNERVRSKITFTYELIGCMAAAFASVLAGELVKLVSIEQAFLIIGLIGLLAIVLTLDYMRPRFGLKPKEYAKKDIEFSK